jgi:acyl-homoserine-lactone acylase
LFAAVAAAGLVPALLATMPSSQAVPARPATYSATITRTTHGIPHIVAKDFGSLGFGSGYAAIQTSGCTLADVLLTARGQRSRYLGPGGHYDDGVSMVGTNLQVDALITDLHNRRVVEKLLVGRAGPGKDARAMVTGYAAGVNAYLRAIGGVKHFPDKACRGAAWVRPNVTPLDIWYGVYTANILASTGHFLTEIVDADPPSTTDPGLPQLPLRASATRFATPDPKKVASLDKDAFLAGLGKDPHSAFGSNATAVGRSITSTGKGMLLGNPHFPWVGRYRFTQQQLTIPGKYDVAGASLIGSPVVNIGWNRNVAWSHTVSTAYRFTPYEYKTLISPTTYLTDKGVRELDHRVVRVAVKKPNGSLGTVTEDMYRTPQGYVIDDPAQFMGWSPLSFFAIRDANAEQLRTIDTFLDMGRATSVRDLLRRQDRGGGMPWVNTIAADRAGNVLYADHSVVPNVSNALANDCMTVIGRLTYQVAGLPGLDGTRADGACAWGTDKDAQRPGIFGPSNLPAEFRTDWVINANDSYWLPNPKQPLEGYARIIGCEQCQRTLRTRMVYHYVLDRIARAKVTPASLRGTEHQNRVFGAEVMSRDNDLVKVCEAAKGGDACDVLAKWDLHSNTTSRGNHIFEEFVKRLPAAGLLPGPSVWKVPFDKDDAANTPRDLDETNTSVIKAMADAIAFLRGRHVPMNATWGSLQVAGDRGAPPIGLGGGLGDEAGNANALASKGSVANKGRYKAVGYGSSHIQAIAFLAGGKVDARTILTYGQSENPASPWSTDQTRMFARKQWVHFAFTPAQIRADAISRKVVSARR